MTNTNTAYITNVTQQRAQSGEWLYLIISASNGRQFSADASKGGVSNTWRVSVTEMIDGRPVKTPTWGVYGKASPLTEIVERVETMLAESTEVKL